MRRLEFLKIGSSKGFYLPCGSACHVGFWGFAIVTLRGAVGVRVLERLLAVSSSRSCAKEGRVAVMTKREASRIDFIVGFKRCMFLIPA